MHAVTNDCMKHIYKVIYDLSVDLVIFDLRLPSKVRSRSQTFQGVASHKWCIIRSLYEIHIARHILPFSLPFYMYNRPFDDIERANQGHWVFSGLYFIN